jgi:Protein of unknown function (DUF3179)
MRWFALFVLAVITLAVLAAPVIILHPFKEETLRGLTLAYSLKHWGLLIDLLAIAAAIAVAMRLWGGRWWRKAIVSFAMLVMIAASALARFNHFEKMFRPLPQPKYAAMNDVNFVDADDMVMTVAHGVEAAAYPIRQLAYHHIVQDVVGGLPVVVTY